MKLECGKVTRGRKERRTEGSKGESKQHQIQIGLCTLQLQEEWRMNITPCCQCMRALNLTQIMLLDIQFVEFIRRVYNMSLSLLSKLF
jgi:hypothetical protein